MGKRYAGIEQKDQWGWRILNKAAPNLLFIAYDLLKGRPDNRDQRASQSTATIKLEYKT